MSSPASLELQSEYRGLLYSVFEEPRKTSQDGLVVAITSANSGEGVSFISRTFMKEIAENTTTGGVLVHLNSLKERALGERSELSTQARADAKTMWRSSLQHRKDVIADLRRRSPNVLIECPALETSSDIFSILTLVDGILVVVEANKTRKDQVRNVERKITSAGGNLLGFIFNKQRQYLPDWLNERL